MNKDLIENLATKLFERYPHDDPKKLMELATKWINFVVAWRAQSDGDNAFTPYVGPLEEAIKETLEDKYL